MASRQNPSWVFGFHAIEGILKREPRRIVQLFVQRDRRDKRAQLILDLAQNQGVAVKPVDRAFLDDSVSGRHQGVLAQVKPDSAGPGMGEQELLSLIESAECPLLLVLDGVTDPHNLGACLRSAAAAGVLAVVVPKNNSADLTGVVRKVASGAAEIVPLVRVTNLARTLEAMKSAGVWLIGAAGETQDSLYEQNLVGPVAIIMGAEGQGLRRLTRESCDYLVRIPMTGAVESLNVSVAAGVFLFEVVRQRGLGSKARPD